MKICIPVSAHDKHLLPDHTGCLLRMGGLEEHQVIYFPTSAAKDAAYEAAERMGEPAQVHPLERDFEHGAPVACNNHFAAVVNALGLMENTDPFLWMELDMLPVAPRWASKLLDDYRMGGTPFRGSVVPTPFNDNGKLVFSEGDTMMMGCGIYPAHMERDERIKPLIADLAKPEWMNPRIPWDVYLRWAMKTIGVSNTPLIADMWATEKYRRSPEGVVCDSVDHGDKVVRKRGGVVSPLTLLVHGCKDGTLAALVLEGKPRPIVEENKVPASSEEFWGEEGKPSEEVIPPHAPKPPIHTVTKAPDRVKQAVAHLTPDTPDTPKTTIARADIEAALGGKKMKIAELAAKLKVDMPALIGTFPTNGYIVATAGWVQSTINITAD